MRLPGGSSTASPVISGIPQGTVLGPLLFIILMSDIDIGVLNAKVVSFADDTRLYWKSDTILEELIGYWTLNNYYIQRYHMLKIMTYYSLISIVYMTGQTLTPWFLIPKNLSIYIFLQVYLLLVIY